MRQASAKRRTGSTSLLDRVLDAVAPDHGDKVKTGAAEEEKRRWYKHPVFRKVLFAVLSLLIAMLLWGYVLMSQNPDREKTIVGVTPKFESGSEADLDTRKLTVYGNIAEVLSKVNVTVSAPLTEISKITADDISATVSLNDLYSSGTYEVEVKATCTTSTGNARVVSVDPSRIEITLDDVVSRSVPITCEFTGELPEAYWHDDPLLFTTSATLEGARSDLENADRAVCFIDLDGLTSTFSSSIQLKVLDTEGNVIDNSVFRNILPSVSVQMRVLPHKHVNVMYELTDLDQIPDLYEIQNESLSVATIDIAAEPDVLAELETVNAVPISLSGIDDVGDYTYPLKLTGIPTSAVIIDGVDRNDIQLTVTVVDKYIYKTYLDVPITFVGESDGLSYHYEFNTADITLYGPAKLISSFVTSDVTVSVNVGGRGVGDYELELEYKFADNDTFGDIDVTFSPERVHVAVSAAPTTE